ncbi:hypothetical protein FRX31_020524, partial [Thalictrum thalictroides]
MGTLGFMKSKWTSGSSPIIPNLLSKSPTRIWYIAESCMAVFGWKYFEIEKTFWRSRRILSDDFA